MDTNRSLGRRWYYVLKKSIKNTRTGHSPSDLVSSNVESDSQATQHSGAGLGPYANEKQMPQWLIRVLKNSDKIVTKQVLGPESMKTSVNLKVIETPGLVVVLARLSEASSTIIRASFCSPKVHHVAKLRREGSFCGYRNIQMMISYICNARIPGHERFADQPLPSVFLLQDMIEQAWEEGFNPTSRDDLGQIRMTRKFIGTSEVEALFLSVKIPVSTRAFVSNPEASAFQQLVKYVADYFNFSRTPLSGSKVVVTELPPIFLQRPGHSVTIVGIDVDNQGAHNLIVFDPHFRPTDEVLRLSLGECSAIKSAKTLKPYRQDASLLERFDAFEVVQLERNIADGR